MRGCDAMIPDQITLGQLVEFDQYLVVAPPLKPEDDVLTPEQEEEFDVGSITRERFVVRQLSKPHRGIIIGLRRIHASHRLSFQDGGFISDSGYWSVEPGSGKAEIIALVSNGFWRSYRVRPDWLREAQP